MSGGLTVGVIGQTMRVATCKAYFASDAGPGIIITDDPGAFAAWESRSRVDVLPIRAGGMAVHRKLRRRIRRLAVEWMRGGSWVGARAEKLIRGLKPTRRFDSAVGTGDEIAIRSGMVAQLTGIHEVTPINLVVVFDLFDLPSVTEFATRNAVPVIVR